MSDYELPSAIIDLSETVESQNWLVYSDPGVGKTALLGQLPNVLIVASDPGIVSAARFTHEANGLRKVWHAKRFPDDFLKIYDYLYDGDHPFEWVGFDSLTRTREKIMRAVRKKRYDQNPEKNNADPDTPELRDYLQTQEKIKALVTDWNELPVNIMWTANVLRTEDQEGDEVVMPLIPGKDYEVSQYICSDMDVVSYYSMRPVGKNSRQEARRLLLQPTGPYFAKNRYDTRKQNGRMLSFIDIAHGDEQLTTMDKVVDYVYNSGPKASGEVTKGKDSTENTETQ